MTRPRNPLEDNARTHPLPASASPLRLCLYVVGDRGFDAHPLPPRGQVTLGRSNQCDIVVADASISRRHALLDVGATLRVFDHGSANGVVVRGRRLAPDEGVELAVGEAFQLGAVTLVVRPLAGRDRSASESTTDTLAARTPADGEPGVVVQEPAMRELFELVKRVAASTINVLVLGETGAGKEVVAEAIHRASPRRERAFVRLNCAALSATLLESELFGHEKGAFTGAIAAKPGLIESAEGGTVFLDEVGEMPLELQTRLLRVLEDRAVLRVGSLRARPVDVRFVSATNRDLRAESARGAFRQDLFFRLGGVSLVVPPLRARPSEIEPLARLFVARACVAWQLTPAPAIAPATRDLLLRYAWPGNARELRNVMERAVLLCADAPAITPAHLPPEVTAVAPLATRAAPDAAPAGATLVPPPPTRTAESEPRTGPLRDSVADVERQRILDALEKCAGNQTRAAELLGISRRTLVSRLSDYDLPRPRKR